MGSCEHCGCLDPCSCSCPSSALAVPLGFPTTHHSATKHLVLPHYVGVLLFAGLCCYMMLLFVLTLQNPN